MKSLKMSCRKSLSLFLCQQFNNTCTQYQLDNEPVVSELVVLIINKECKVTQANQSLMFFFG